MVRYYYDGSESSSSLGDGEQPMLAEILLSRLPTPVVRVDWKVLQMAVRRPQAAPSGSVEASIMRRYQLRHCERMREALGRLWNTASLGEEVMSKGDFVAWHALLSRALLARTDERTGLIVADCEWALYCLDSLEDGMPQGPFEEWCFEVLESWAPTTYAGAKASSEAEISVAMSDLVDELIEALTVRGAKHELRPLDEVEWLGLSRPESYIHGLPTLLNWPQCRFLVAAALAWRGPTEPSKAQLIEIARGRMQSPPPPTGASAPPSTHALQSRLAQPQAGLGASSMLDTALGRSVAPLDELRPFALDVAPLPRLDGMVARRAQQRSGQRSAVGSSTAWSSECGSADASSSSHFGVPSTADADAEAVAVFEPSAPFAPGAPMARRRRAEVVAVAPSGSQSARASVGGGGGGGGAGAGGGGGARAGAAAFKSSSAAVGASGPVVHMHVERRVERRGDGARRKRTYPRPPHEELVEELGAMRVAVPLTQPQPPGETLSTTLSTPPVHAKGGGKGGSAVLSAVPAPPKPPGRCAGREYQGEPWVSATTARRRTGAPSITAGVSPRHFVRQPLEPLHPTDAATGQPLIVPPADPERKPPVVALSPRLPPEASGSGPGAFVSADLRGSTLFTETLKRREYLLERADLHIHSSAPASSPRLVDVGGRRARLLPPPQLPEPMRQAAAAQAAVRTARAVLGPDAIKRLEARARGAIMAAVGPLVPGVPLNTPITALHTLSTPATADACDDAGGPAEPLEVFGSVDATLLDELAGIGRSELESPGWSTTTSQLRNELATWITLSRGRVSYLNREKSKTSQVTASSAKAALKEGVRTPLELSRNEIRTRLERQHGPFELLALRTALEAGETVTGR